MSFGIKKIKANKTIPPIKSGKLFYSHDKLQLWEGDARNMDFIRDNSVQLIVTSPPYNVVMEYGDTWNDAMPVVEYLNFTKQWLNECYRVLCTGGRIAINCPSALTQYTGSKIAFVAMDIWNIAVKEIGFLPSDWIIWNKPIILANTTSWGSWCSQSAPSVRDKAEFILVFCKKSRRLDPRGKKSDLTKDEFVKLTQNVWTMVPENNRKMHPAPFPLELPLRLIKLYCFPSDLVLDPFVGSGTTLLAAKLLDRCGIGIDINPKFLAIAKERIAQDFLFDKNVILTKFSDLDEQDTMKVNSSYKQLELKEVK